MSVCVWYCDVFIFLRGYDAHYLIGTFEVIVALFYLIIILCQRSQGQPANMFSQAIAAKATMTKTWV
jgi:hypothetical protein